MLKLWSLLNLRDQLFEFTSFNTCLPFLSPLFYLNMKFV